MTIIKGFTIIEFLIVIGITAIISGFVVLNLYNYRQRQDLNLTVQEIASVLRSAQNHSIDQDFEKSWGVHFENPVSGGDFYDLFIGRGYTTSSLFSRNVLRSGVEFIDLEPGSYMNIVFAPVSGLPIGGLATVKISLVGNSSVSSTVIINANGKIEF